MAKLTLSEIQYWMDEVKSCEERQKKQLIERWKYPTLISYYEGDLLVEAGPRNRGAANQKMSAIINKHFPKTNVLIGEIMYQNPEILCDPTKPFVIKGEETIDVEARTPLMQSAIKYAYDKIGLQEEDRIALFDMIYAGYCAVEVDQILETDKPQDNIPDQKTADDRDKGLVGKMVDNIKKKISGVEEAQDQLEREQPNENEPYSTTSKTFGKRWDPLNVLFDWQAERVKDCRYIIKKRVMSKSKFDAEFPKFKDKVTAGTLLDFAQHTNDCDKKSVVVYELQIRKANNEYWTLKLTPTYTQGELDYYKRPYQMNGFNMKIGTLHKYGKIYPVPIARINKVLSDEMNEYLYNWKDVAERNVPKYVIDMNKVNADGIDALRSNKTNDIVSVDGAPQNAAVPLPATNLSNDNKELLSIFQGEQEKTWSVSDSRIGGQQEARFATEIQIQEAGFRESSADIQDGLRQLITEEVEALKDIIVVFWDEEYFFKVTGGEKPEWYIPEVVNGVVTNPLTDLLTSDYHIKIDISKAMRPNSEKEKSDLVMFLREMTGPQITTLLQQQGRTISRGFIDKITKKFGIEPDIAFEPYEAPQPQPQAQPGQGAGNPEEEAMIQQLLAEAPMQGGQNAAI